jgi:AraC-like DNA-binding protein
VANRSAVSVFYIPPRSPHLNGKVERSHRVDDQAYQELLDGTRKQAAAQYLNESTLTIGEVACLVGFSEPAAFHRAFKRCSDAPPNGFGAGESSNNDRHCS